VPSGGTGTLQPGRYAAGMNFGSNRTYDFTPGTYYVTSGAPSAFDVNSTTTLTCSACINGHGVTIVMTDTAAGGTNIGGININGGANVNLTAPTINDPAT
jgi:hypothetical protein